MIVADLKLTFSLSSLLAESRKFASSLLIDSMKMSQFFVLQSCKYFPIRKKVLP